VVANVASNSLYSLFCNDGCHDQCGKWISPPQAKNSVQKQSRQENSRKVSAKIGLFGVGMHCGTAEGGPHFAFSSR